MRDNSDTDTYTHTHMHIIQVCSIGMQNFRSYFFLPYPQRKFPVPKFALSPRKASQPAHLTSPTSVGRVRYRPAQIKIYLVPTYLFFYLTRLHS